MENSNKIDEPRVITKYKVYETESERGWGSDTTTLYFDSEKDAAAHVHMINSRNTAPTAPDYYVVAELGGKVEGVMVKGKFRELK